MGEIICPYCKATVGGGSDAVCCRKCGTRHHRVCWLEYDGQCSVFSCQGKSIAFHKSAHSNALLIIWSLLNYVLHLSLRLIGEITHSFTYNDLFVVIALEVSMIATGLLLIKARSLSDSVRTFSILLFSGNAIFVSFLLSQYLSYGFEKLNGLIRL